MQSGYGYVCALSKLDQKIKCWGNDQFGQYQIGLNNDLGVVEGIVSFSLSGFFTCLVNKYGSVGCYGSGSRNVKDVPEILRKGVYSV